MDQRDLLIKNGKILCMDGGRCADWLLTHDGKVSRLGVGDCRPEYISGTVQTIDAKGRTVLPGFIDNHFEVGWSGAVWTSLPPGITSRWARSSAGRPQSAA